MSEPNCVCGCPCAHPEHCSHGCTCPMRDDGVDQGGPLNVKSEPYSGVYAGKRWELA